QRIPVHMLWQSQAVEVSQRERMEIRSASDIDLPGFRFHPTEEELLDFYLRRKVQGKRLQLEIIATVNLYRHDPWELPGIATVRADFCSDRKSSRDCRG
ncbi:hypothetical protein GW17_00053088, partial [Ensete ventricosum]